MPTIQFTANDYGPEVSSDQPEGARLFNICDAINAPILFSCRDAKCGICRLELLEGAEHFEPALPPEVALLKQMRAPAGQRLACQAVLKPGPGLVRVSWAGGTPTM